MAVENDAMTIKGAIAARAEGAVAAPAPPALYPPRTAKGLDPTAGDFTFRVEAFRRAWLAQPGARPVGYVQEIDLDPVRRHFGRRWVWLRERALQLVESTLEQRLGPEDVYLVMSENLVWVLALGVERRAIEVRGRLVASELTRRLCGALPGGVAVQFSTRLVDFAALGRPDEPMAVLRRLAGLGTPGEATGTGPPAGR